MLHIATPEVVATVGVLSVTVRDAVSSAIRRHFTIRNQITSLTADVMLELLAQRASDPPSAYNKCHSMRMGSSNTAPTRADTNLGAFTIGKELGDVGKITGLPGEVQFIATLSAGDANGTTLREAGLFTAGPTPGTSDVPGVNGHTACRMLARQVYADIPKTSAIVIDYTWIFAFTATP